MSLPKRGTPKSVADMPAQVRRACECLVAGMGTGAIVHKMGIGKSSVQALLDRARQMTGMKDRDALVDWCRRGGNVRQVASEAPYPSGSVRTTDGVLVQVYVYSVLQMLREEYPDALITEGARLSAERRMAQDRAVRLERESAG